MKIKTAAPVIIIGFIIAIFSSFTAIAVIDAPHNASNNISCGSCHGEALHYSAFWGGSFTPADIDDTPYNRICLSCHTVSSPGEGGYPQTKGPLVKTHSSLNTDNGYGDWTRECRTCHDPHYQRQKNYKTTESGNLYLATGTITRCDYNPPVPPEVVGTSTLTYSTITYKSGWYPPPEDDPNKKYLTKKTSDYRRTILFPNVGKLGYNYPIIGVDEGAKTITVTGDATAYLYPPTTFAVIYGQYIKDSIDIKADPSVSPPPASIYKTVKFFDKADTKSFADGDTTFNGVCEVCHTQTKYFTNTGGVLDQIHINKVRTNCISCHSHVEGFKPSCKACHGYPPLVDTPTSPDGLVWVTPTGSTTAGEHQFHATESGKNYSCDACHYQNIVQAGKHNTEPRNITMGFYMFDGTYQGGNYNGQSGVSYNTTTTTPPTTVTTPPTGAKQCSNLYCHSSGQGAGGTWPPTYATPVWDGTVVCGDCHKGNVAPLMDSGSHTAHVQSNSYACSICHSGVGSGTVKHVDNNIDIAFTSLNPSGTYSQSPNTPGNGYGTCSSTYCHVSGTPQWGGTNSTTDCTWCHGGNAASAAPITLVNHPAHMNQASVLGTNYECAQCHSTTVSAGNDKLITGAVHANGTKDVSMLMGGTWTAGTAICSSVYCHSSGKGTYVNPSAWGSSTNLGCNGCHGTSNAIGWPDYANEGAGMPNANSHISHVTISADCNTCHTNTTTTGTAIKAGTILHTNQALDINFDTTKAGGSATWTAGTKTCSNISCHCDTNAQWGQTLTCLDCHSGSCGSRAAITSQFSANSHHIQGVPLTGTHCYQCHWEANVDGTINSKYHGGSKAPGSAVDLVIYGNGSRPSDDSGTVIHYVADGSRGEIKNLNTHCLSCHSDQNNDTVPFGDGKTPRKYAWDNGSVDARYSQAGTTAWVRYGGDADVPIINESFEETKGGGNDGYDEFSQGAKADATLNPDYTPIPGTPPYGVDFGFQCLQSAVVLNHGKQAYATRDLGSEITKTLTSFYLYVENAQEFTGDSYKNIAIFKNSEGANNVIIFRLFYIDVNQLQFNLRIYNNGWRDYYYPETGYISLSTWYKIDIKYDNINDTWEWRVDGEIQPDTILNNTLIEPHRDGIQIWDFGFIGTGVGLTGTIYFDLISVEGHNIGNFTPKNTQTKAYSAHGNAINNQGGWDLNETWPNTRNGTESTENIACFDCHNSHGSSASGVTSSYTSNYTGAPVNGGGILKNTAEGKGGYSMNYQPQAGGSTTDKNAYNAGAGLCFDCHMNATAGTTPWGYSSTFGATATQPIMGYRDTQYFGPGTSSGPQQRFLYKAITPPNGARSKGGHFGASSTLSSTPTATIGGLCTPCHDPHGVSSTLEQEYAVPLLKGTWLTSFYKEDRAPAINEAGTIKKEGVQYHIDQNTFGSDIEGTGIHARETDSQFAGLCLNCHPKNSLTNGTNHQWKSKDRVHESVKGWKTADTTIQHNYPCSKCHASHNARLPRLMVTNCFDRRLKGRKESIENNNNPVLSGEGYGCMNGDQYCDYSYQYPWGTPDCYGKSLELGYCPLNTFNWETRPGPNEYDWATKGYGGGNFPGKWVGGWADNYNGYSYNITCHENQPGSAIDQSWNNVTQWYNDRPVILYPPGPTAGPFTLDGADIQVTITWTTDIASTSYVDYGVTSSYGSTAGNSTLVTEHSVILTGLTNYSTHHYRVRSAGPQGTEVVSGDNTLDSVAFPPSVPSLIDEPDNFCDSSCPVTLVWNASVNPGNGGLVEYQVQVKKQTTAWTNSEYDSGWISGTSYEMIDVRPDPNTTWNWRVRARDAVHHLTSEWSSVDDFKVFQLFDSPPLDPILIDEPDIISSVPVDITLEWNSVTCPDGHSVEYYVEADDDPDFDSDDPEVGNPPIKSDWISGDCIDNKCSWTVPIDFAKTWYWRVKARDAYAEHIDRESPWSTPDSFVICTPLINESFELNPGYDETWTETIGISCPSCILNEDSDFPTCTPPTCTPPTDAGSQCLQSISASPGYQAYATRDLGSEQTKTFTSFYVYVGDDNLGPSTWEDIGTLLDGGGKEAIIFRLFRGSAGNLKFRLCLYNNSGWTNYESTVISWNTWYKIDIKYDDINHTWEWRLDGITQDPGTPGTLGGTHRTGIQQWVLGFQGSQGYTGTIYLDLIKVNTLSYQ